MARLYTPRRAMARLYITPHLQNDPHDTNPG